MIILYSKLKLFYSEESHSQTNERDTTRSLLNCIQARSHLWNWNLIPNPLCCIISFLSIELHLGLWKGPIVCSIGPTVHTFPDHICQASLVSCHLDLSNYIPIWCRVIHTRKHRWIASMARSLIVIAIIQAREW